MMAATGGVIVIGALLWYQVALVASPVIGIANIGSLEDVAYATLAILSVGLTLAFVGITLCLRRLRSGSNPGHATPIMNRISLILSGERSAKTFALVAVAYGLFYGVVSSTLVFQPGLAFSNAYGVRVPSAVPVLCCGTFGQMPQLVVYVTQQFAILIIPLNLILLFTVSWLVGLNAAIASYVYINRPQVLGLRWITGLGAIVGLFTACPTCAGFFFLTMLGLAGSVGLALSLSSLQTVFIVASIPILLITPILASRPTDSIGVCSIRKNSSTIA
jgi:hypothetical protein